MWIMQVSLFSSVHTYRFYCIRIYTYVAVFLGTGKMHYSYFFGKGTCHFVTIGVISGYQQLKSGCSVKLFRGDGVYSYFQPAWF